MLELLSLARKPVPRPRKVTETRDERTITSAATAAAAADALRARPVTTDKSDLEADLGAVKAADVRVRTIVSLATKLDTTPRETSPPPLPEDVRARRPFFLAGGPLKAAARRIGQRRLAARPRPHAGSRSACTPRSALREIVTGSRPILWGLIWRDAEANWLPFLALVLVLVFWQKGLYAERERRGGIGQIVSSLVIVAVLTLAFGDRHRLPLHDLRDLPDRARLHDRPDRDAPRELRRRHEGHLPPDRAAAARGARRRGRQRRAPAQEPRPRARRGRVRVSRCDRAVAGRRRPAACSAASGTCPRCSRRTTSTS